MKHLSFSLAVLYSCAVYTAPPLYGKKNFGKKGVTEFSPEICLQKGLKIEFFAQKTPDFDPKNKLRI